MNKKNSIFTIFFMLKKAETEASNQKGRAEKTGDTPGQTKLINLPAKYSK